MTFMDAITTSEKALSTATFVYLRLCVHWVYDAILGNIHATSAQNLRP